jgi:copper resistance protein B
MMRRIRMAVVVLTLTGSWPGVVSAQHVHGEPTPAPVQAPPAAPLPSFIPAVTDTDRAAAFPDVGDHEVHGTSVHSLVLFDHLEWQSDGTASVLAFEAQGWVGGDLNRLWFRTDGTGADGRMNDAMAEVFYGRAFARWWDVVAGVRQDVEPGPARTWAAVGLQGLAPYWFEVDATAYIGDSWRTRLHLSADYDLLLTNRLMLQPAAALDAFGKADPERNIGAGLSAVEAAIRVRYEIRREFAPYAGVVWQWRTGDTADLARAAGEPVSETRIVVGARVWF